MSQHKRSHPSKITDLPPVKPVVTSIAFYHELVRPVGFLANTVQICKEFFSFSSGRHHHHSTLRSFSQLQRSTYLYTDIPLDDVVMERHLINDSAGNSQCALIKGFARELIGLHSQSEYDSRPTLLCTSLRVLALIEIVQCYRPTRLRRIKSTICNNILVNLAHVCLVRRCGLSS